MRAVGEKSEATPRPGHGLKAAGCALLVVLAGCGEPRDKGTGQVVASVNGTEITVHQVNYELAKARASGAAKDGKLFMRALDSLIDQQLVAERAEADKLDRDPQVLQALEQVRRQVLGQAYVERALNAARPTADEIKAFYAEHPALFQKRRIYSFRDFILDRADFTDEIRGKLEDPRARDDLGGALKRARIGYRETASTRSAEQLPMENLAAIAKMGKGEFSEVSSDQNVILMQLVESAEQPVSLEQATPFIEQYLLNARRKQSLEAKLKELRAAAKITYANSVQRPAAEQGASPEPVPAGATKAAATTGDGAMDEQSMRKGLRGLVGK